MITRLTTFRHHLSLLLSCFILSSLLLSAAPPLKIISYNVLYGFNHKKSIDEGVAWVADQKPDVIAFQEFRGFSKETLQGFAKQWGHDHVHLYKRSPGMPLAISSKFPITEVEEISKGIKRGFFVAKSADIHFVVIHMMSQKLSARKKELQLISTTVKKLQQENKKVIVLGDFNSLSPLDKNYLATKTKRLKEMQEKKSANLNNGQFDYSILQGFYDLGLVDVCHEKLKGSPILHGSFPTTVAKKVSSPQIQEEMLVRIDFMLMSPDLAKAVTKADIPKGGALEKISDHYPVIVEIKP